MEGRLNRKFFPILKICRFETDVKLFVMNENCLRLKREGKQEFSEKRICLITAMFVVEK
jgi:hypothetical protein